MSNCIQKRIILLEAFYGGSHRQLVDTLERILVETSPQDTRIEKICMTDKKWHWRMRTSALYFSQQICQDPTPVRTLFVSSVINLAELIGLCKPLQDAYKILYFHENQLVYPVRKQQERDFQYGYNQILSCIAADIVLFNSSFNMTSFLDNIQSYLNLMPDYRPKGIKEQISHKCCVLYYLFSIPTTHLLANTPGSSDGMDEQKVVDSKQMSLHIVWPHRWEHDKNPKDFFDIIFQLHDADIPFRLSVLGQIYSDVPEIFEEAKTKLKDHIEDWGFQESKEKYFSILTSADVVVSTALHEFFGVSMLEAVSCKCYPLCPNRLVYPEFFPECYLYNTKQQLKKKLTRFCTRPDVVRNHRLQVDLSKFQPAALEDKYLELFT